MSMLEFKKALIEDEVTEVSKKNYFSNLLIYKCDEFLMLFKIQLFSFSMPLSR